MSGLFSRVGVLAVIRADRGHGRPGRPGRPGGHGRTLSIVWFGLTGLGLAAVLVEPLGVPELVTELAIPGWAPRAGAGVITTMYAVGLAARTGGRTWVSGALALLLAAAAVLSGHLVLVAGVAVSTAVLAGVLGVMATRSTQRFLGVVRECVIATAVAVVGGFAVVAYDAQVSFGRVSYLSLGLSLLGALVLVSRLSAGTHRLGGRGAVLGGVLLLLVAFAYSEALARWGSPELVRALADATRTVHSTLGAAPRPLEVFVGFPALVWGVSTRVRSRRGWWVCAFAAPALALVAVSLLDAERSLKEAGLSLAYSAALGILVGFLVIGTDSFVTRVRGRRTARIGGASAQNPEPGRLQPLL